MKWKTIGYYFDGNKSYVILQNDRGETKMKLTKQV